MVLPVFAKTLVLSLLLIEYEKLQGHMFTTRDLYEVLCLVSVQILSNTCSMLPACNVTVSARGSTQVPLAKSHTLG